MEPERNEVYERIPWETLEDKKPDRQWLVFAVAGAVVVGALAYSFTSSRPIALPPGSEATVEPTIPPSPAVSAAPPPVAATAPPATPVVTAEADLYAVHPERILDEVMAHAEWFVAEYLTVDGSDQGKATLAALLPAGVPPPVAPEGTRVFVESVRARSVEEVAPLTYRVTVLARSLAATGEAAYQRQAPVDLVVDVVVGEDGPQVAMPPTVTPAAVPTTYDPGLSTVPDDVGAAALEQSGGSEVVGGRQNPTGGWQVVVLVTGADGVSRSATVQLP